MINAFNEDVVYEMICVDSNRIRGDMNLIRKTGTRSMEARTGSDKQGQDQWRQEHDQANMDRIW